MQHYDDVIEEFCMDNPDLDIYLAGEVSHPGISDLDFLVLDEKPVISERVKKYLKGGNIIIYPSHLFHKIDYIEQFNLELLQGTIREREKPPVRPFKAVEILEWAPERLCFCDNSLEAAKNIHLTLKSARRCIDYIDSFMSETDLGWIVNHLREINEIRMMTVRSVERAYIHHVVALGHLVQEFNTHYYKHLSSDTLFGIVDINDYYKFNIADSITSNNEPYECLLSYWNIVTRTGPCQLTNELLSRCRFLEYEIRPEIIDKDYEAFAVERWKILNEVFVWFREKGYKKGMIKYGWLV